jgi:4-hydroxy-tetrahydrodipicolinate synthase
VGSRALSGRLRSVFVTTVTPFDGAGDVDYGALSAHVEFLVDSGVDVLVPCGNTGEFSSLGVEEAKRVTAATVDAAAGRAVVIAGVGWSAPLARELGLAAQEAGADGVMVHHPSHTYIDREGLRRYYEQLLAALDIGVVMYKRGPEVSDRLLADLVTHERVVGVKYAVNDLHAFADLVASSPPDVAWLCGTAERWAPFFHLAGAVGFSSGIANFAPRKSLALLDALDRGDWARAMEIRSELAPFEDLRQERFGGYNVPAVKEAVRLLGYCEATVRDPLVELEPAAASFVRETVTAWGGPVRARAEA